MGTTTITDSYDPPGLHHTFTRACLSKFRFLTAYGFGLMLIQSDRYGAEVTYKNETTAIKISLDIRENDISIYLIRLIQGEIPAYLDAPSRWFYLDNVVRFRSSSTTLPRKNFGDWLTPHDIDHLLSTYAGALPKYAEDVLLGDFTVFRDLARQIDRPRPRNNNEDIRLIRSNEELKEQKQRLSAQIAEYYDAYFSELRDQLQRSDLFSEAIPDFLKGYKKVISIGGQDGLVVAHLPARLEINISKIDGGEVLKQIPSVLNAKEDSYEFMQFPGQTANGLATLLSEGEDVGFEIPHAETFWGVRVFKAPQQKIDPTTGELAWQAPWTRLVAADLYHLRFWEDTERARKEAREDVEPYVRRSETANVGQQPISSRWVHVPDPKSKIREKLVVGTGLFPDAA